MRRMYAGGYMVLQQPVLIDILGLERFAQSFAIFLIFNGLSSLACQPFSGIRISHYYLYLLL